MFNRSIEIQKDDETMLLQNERSYQITIKQTAGRDHLGDFAPEFAHFNDDILFGEN